MGFWGDDLCEAVLFCCLMLMVAFILGLRKLAQPCRNFLFYFLFMPGTPVGPRGVTGLA